MAGMKGTLELVIVRHGESMLSKEGVYYGKTDIPLSQEGIGQALQAGQLIRNECFDALYTSPLSRCIQTAHALQTGRAFEISKDLAEINFGVWEGLSYKDVMQKHPARWQAFMETGDAFVFAQGESGDLFFARARKALEDMKKRHPQGGKVLVVTHLGVLRVWLACALELGQAGIWRFSAPVGSVTRLAFVDGYGVLKTLGLQ